METNYPNDIYDYYRSNPSMFEERVDSRKRMTNIALASACVLLLIIPSIIPIGNLLVRIIAVTGLCYFGLSVLSGGKSWYSKQSGGKIVELAIKKFATPERGTVPGGADDRKVMDLFANSDWAGLADEPEAGDRPLQLFIHEDAVGKTFYVQLRRYFSSSDFRGVTEVKEIKEPQYSGFYQIIKSIQTTA
ncbi:MAG: hypothetical protein LBK07_10025 [Tannerella sp.]|jgi:hypothetical protein|nr:hypothetical protein [Tannerella sp.]